MSAWRIGWRLLRGDWRSGELYLLTAALALTVAAITAVGFLTNRVDTAMQRQGGELIAADLVITGATPLDPGLAANARERQLRTARSIGFRSVAGYGEHTQLVRVNAVDAAYPLRGQIMLRHPGDSTDTRATGAPPSGSVWVEPRLLTLLGCAVGDRLEIGAAQLRIAATLSRAPDAGEARFSMAPRLLMNHADLPASALLTPASRADHRLLVAGGERALADFRAWAEPQLAPDVSIQDAAETRPAFATALRRAGRFLQLATLATLLVAGAAIVLATRRLVERQTDAVAVMRCLGAPRRLLTRVFLWRLLLFGVLASLLGCLLGWLAQAGLARLLADWFTETLPAPSLAPLGTGLGVGLIALAGFAAPALLQLARVPPLRALRRELGTPRLATAASVGAAILALTAIAFWQAGHDQLAWQVLFGAAGALLALGLTALALVAMARLLVTRARGAWRLGLAGLARRPATTTLQLGGFGLGILALLLLAIIRVELLDGWRQSLPPRTANQFLINIQPEESAALRDFLGERGIAAPTLYPMVRARLLRIGERAVNPDSYPNARARQLATREFNLSYGTRLQSDNRILSGHWWGTADSAPQLSVEQGLAETLGIALGDRLTFWVAGHEISAPVTSLREVQWDSFNVNFFVISPPAWLAGEPQTYITAFYLPPGRDALLAELARRFPGVTPIDVTAILQQVRTVIDRGALAVEFVFAFALLAGLLVMAAGIQATLEERRQAHGILRALGARPRVLLTSVTVEFAGLGLLAGLLATTCAELLGRLLAERVFELEYHGSALLWLAGIGGSALAIGLAGTLAAWPLLRQPPLPLLRGG